MMILQHGLTPLHVAAKEGHDAIVQILIQEGADINAVTKVNIPSAYEKTFGQILTTKTCIV